jgi:hypothetical protein
MKAIEALRQARAAGDHWQLPVSQLMDDLRRASPSERAAMLAEPITENGPLEGLVAATVSALCRELGIAAPAWVAEIHSPEPFFAFPARGFAARVRLMIESPPPFRIRNVFVPATYLDRALADVQTPRARSRRALDLDPSGQRDQSCFFFSDFAPSCAFSDFFFCATWSFL